MKKIFNKKNSIIFSATLLSLLLFFVFAKPAQASFGTTVASIIDWVLSLVISLIGSLIGLIISILVGIAEYNGFGTAAPVIFGWSIVRDVCNMFFILILLIIAFATILQIESYSMKKYLPKLIMMAVLINFSRLICNIFVDFAQVIMLTFVNGFKDVTGGNINEMLGLTNWVGQPVDSTSTEQVVSFTSMVGTYILALIYSIITLVVLVSMLAALVMRMVMLWVYITISPLAYLLSAFPGGEKYSGQWWNKFTENLVVGPILAFFIWLSFASLGGTTNLPTGAQSPVDQAQGGATGAPQVGDTTAGSYGQMMKFIISIGMLLGGLQIAQQAGGDAGKMAGKGAAAIQKMGSGTQKYLTGKVQTGLTATGATILSTAPVRNALASVGSQSGVGGRILQYTGIRNLATKGAIAGTQYRENVREAAQKKARLYASTDKRLVDRLASEHRLSLSGQEEQTAALNLSPTALARNFNRAAGVRGVVGGSPEEVAVRNQVNGMGAEAINRLSTREITALGKSGIDFDPTSEFAEIISTNARLRGLFNLGRDDAGELRTVGVDRQGNPLTGPNMHGAVPGNPVAMNALLRRTAATTHRWRTDDDFFPEDDDYDSPINDKDVKNEIVKNQNERIGKFVQSDSNVSVDKVREKLDSWNKADGKDHFKDDNQVKEAVNQVKTETLQNEKISKLIQPGQNVSPDEVREKIDVWNKVDQKDHFEDDNQIKEAIVQAMKESGRVNKGKMAINEFAGVGRKESSNTVAVDFNSLGLEKVFNDYNPKKSESYKGFNTSDQGEIKVISSKMVDIIDGEINSLKSKGDLNGGEQKRLVSLEAAKSKFGAPEKLKNLSFVNSSATNYKPSDIKTTKIHEEVHGLGFDSEAAAEYAAQSIVQTRNYGARKNAKSINKVLSTDSAHESVLNYAKENYSGSAKSMKEIVEIQIKNDINKNNSNSNNSGVKSLSGYFANIVSAVKVGAASVAGSVSKGNKTNVRSGRLNNENDNLNRQNSKIDKAA